jgi:hypothetical protein
MNHKLRALFVTLALLVFAAPAAFAANSIGGADAAVPPGVTTIAIAVESDNDLRGVGFSWDLQNVDAISAAVMDVRVVTTQLNDRRVAAVADQGYIFLAGRNGADDLAAGGPTTVVEIDVDIQGVTGNLATLNICGVNPWPNNGILVEGDAAATRVLVSCDLIDIVVQALVVTDIIAVCPDAAGDPENATAYEGSAVAHQVAATIFAGVFNSFDLIDIKKDGISTVPTNAPEVTGLGGAPNDPPNATEIITSWVPAAGEAGTWEFCYETTNDLGDADTGCVTHVVAAPGGDHAQWNAPYVYEFTSGSPFGVSFSWSLTYQTDLQGAVGPFVLTSVSGGAFFDAPITEPAGDFTNDMSFGPDFAAFASKSANTYGNDAVSPDSVLGGLISFGAAITAPKTSTVYAMAATMQDVEGIMQFNQAEGNGFPPANKLSYNDPAGGTLIPTYAPGCFAFTIIRNLAPTVGCPVAGVGPIIFGDPVSIPGFTCDDPDGGPGPETFSVVSMELDGSPAVPTNAPGFTGDTFEWQTSNADENDVGIWAFEVQCNDGADNSVNTCSFTVEVIAQVPAVCFRFGCVEDVLTGSDVCVPLYIDNIDPCKELGGFDLLFTYDATMLTFNGMDIAGSVLESAGWEYMTYRIVSTNPAKVRIVAIADMNNSNNHPNTLCLDGVLANVCFRTTADQSFGCQSSSIRFSWDDCGDNTASSADGNSLFMITNPNGAVPWGGGDPTQGIPGGGIIDNSCGIQAQLATFNGGITGPADFPCLNPDPNKPTPEECLYFVNGKVQIICPGDIDDRGDINLNALAYEIADGVLYSNYFISGPSVFTINVAGQTAASDVNADGTPLTVADLVYLIRVITGDATPIVGDLLGGGPKVAAVVGTINVMSAQQGSNVRVSTSSDVEMGAGLFVFNYTGSDIVSVSAVGRASDMNVKWEAANGELRVLVLPQMGKTFGRQQVSAGTGEILNITTHGANVELVSVEAASFMGGVLEADVSAKVLPTQFALHQNYPNPFNPSTQMAIDFPAASDYKLTIYNVAGQVVKTFSGQAEAGTTTVKWDGRSDQGTQVATGVYFYAVEAGSFAKVNKMVLMK